MRERKELVTPESGSKKSNYYRLQNMPEITNFRITVFLSDTILDLLSLGFFHF
jgi:hypothetical protein